MFILLLLFLVISLSSQTAVAQDDCRSKCTFPFTYGGVSYNDCTLVRNAKKPWCAFDATYVAGKWCNCEEKPAEKPKDDSCRSKCVFPFTYQGVSYNACTSKNAAKPWCAFDATYDVGKKRWCNCEEPVKDPSCRSNCTFPFKFQGKDYDSCTSVGSEKPWCSYNATHTGKWCHCEVAQAVTDDSCQSNCEFPFTYKGTEYDSCTSANWNKPWCSYNATYIGKWCYCEPEITTPIPTAFDDDDNDDDELFLDDDDDNLFDFDDWKQLDNLKIGNLEELDEESDEAQQLMEALDNIVEASLTGAELTLPEAFKDLSFDVPEPVTDAFEDAAQYRIGQAFKSFPLHGFEINYQKFEGGSKEIKDRETGAVIRTQEVTPGTIISGVVAQSLDFQIPEGAENVNPSEFLENHKASAWSGIENMQFRDDIGRVMLYVDPSSGELKVGVEMRYFAHQPSYNTSSRPYRIVDPFTGDVISEFEALTTQDIVEIGTGPGGNPKGGRHQFGKDYPKIRLTKTGNTCVYETEYVRTIKLSGKGANPQEPFTIDCSGDSAVHQGEEVNQGFSPVNDGHYFIDQVAKMYNDWYQTRPLGDEPVVLKVHGPKKDQAEWNGEELVIYSGEKVFYPLTSLDVMAHEFGHGVTEKCSGLEYRGQSGGINEAFSDMTGKAAEFFLRGADKVNWTVGLEIFKDAGKGIRYMDTPSKDGKSIEHVRDYVKGMDVHYSSGIYNKVFHCLAQAPSWGIQKAYDMFYIANCKFWRSKTNFKKGAKDALRAMTEMKENGRYLPYDYSGVKIEEAIECFKKVGIKCKPKKSAKYKCKLKK